MGADDNAGEIFTHDAVDIEKPARNLMYRWAIEGRWKLIVRHWANVPDRQAELYELLEDPHDRPARGSSAGGGEVEAADRRVVASGQAEVVRQLGLVRTRFSPRAK